jgi:hypothetical protein
LRSWRRQAWYTKETARRCAMSRLIRAYCERFGDMPGGTAHDDETVRLMKLSLKTGVDQDQLADMRRKQRAAMAKQKRERKAFLAKPISAETERDYSGGMKRILMQFPGGIRVSPVRDISRKPTYFGFSTFIWRA